MGMKLEFDALCCGYNGKQIVHGFSATVHSGEILCLLGPNGVGKTTLFKTALGFVRAMGGRILINGRDTQTMNRTEFAKVIAYVPQAHVPPFPFTAKEVILMGRTAHIGAFGSPSRRDHTIVEQMMGRLCIEHLQDRIYTELSGGERQMVLIARALSQEPAFLMMDEPTSNLDFGNQVRVLEQVNRLAENGLGILMTTHFPDHAFLCHGNVVLMQKQSRYLYGSAQDVITKENLKAAYSIDVNVLEHNIHGQMIRYCLPVLSHQA